MSPRGSFDDLRAADDYACTITREQYLRAQERADADEVERVEVRSGLGEQPSGMKIG